MGLVPCFYWWNTGLFLASPSLDAILSQREVDDRVNRALVAEYLQNVRAALQIHETFYEDVRRLPPAHGVRPPHPLTSRAGGSSAHPRPGRHMGAVTDALPMLKDPPRADALLFIECMGQVMPSAQPPVSRAATLPTQQSFQGRY